MTEVKVRVMEGWGMEVMPYYATSGSAAMDLIAAIPEKLVLQPGARAYIPAGICIELPPGFEAQVRPRSGLAAHHGITVLNGPGTIDSDYRGEIGALLINHGQEPFTVEPLMRVAQMTISAVLQVMLTRSDELSVSARGDGGFGHTGL